MIFFSYSWKDWNYVKILIDELKLNFGEKFFFLDRKDIEINHPDYGEKLDYALEKCTIFIPYITENYIISSACKKEMHIFQSLILNNSFKK